MASSRSSADPTEAAARAQLQGEIVARFANVSVIDGREMLTTIRTVIENVTLAVTVVGSLVLLSGVLILIGAVAMTKFRRIYEAAIFKTLGATRRMIASVLLLEYGVLGALAGTIGSVGAIALTWGISRYALDIPWSPLPLISVVRRRPQRAPRGHRRRGVVLGSAAAKAPGDAARRMSRRSGVIGRGATSIDRLMLGLAVRPRHVEFDVMNVSTYRDARFFEKRAELEQTAGLRPLQTPIEHNNGRQGDMADQASGNNEVHIHLKLKQTDAKILQAIDEALAAHREGHLRHLPRLRRADRRGAAERHPLDAGVHHLQGKAEGVTPTELQTLLREFYLERLALLMRHESSAPVRVRLRRQQRLPERHQPRRRPCLVAAARTAGHGPRDSG